MAGFILIILAVEKISTPLKAPEIN